MCSFALSVVRSPNNYIITQRAHVGGALERAILRYQETLERVRTDLGVKGNWGLGLHIPRRGTGQGVCIPGVGLIGPQRQCPDVALTQ